MVCVLFELKEQGKKKQIAREKERVENKMKKKLKEREDQQRKIRGK